MDLCTLLIFFIFFVPLVFIIYWELKKYYSVVNKLPGPTYMPFIGTVWDIIKVTREDIFGIFISRGQMYYPLFRTWMGSIPEVHFMKPDHLEIVMSSSELITKGHTYKFLAPWLGNGLLINTGKEWHTRRKMLTPAFHFKILEDFSEVFIENSDKLADRLSSECNGQYFDIYPYVNYCALDIICETAMGVKLNSSGSQNRAYVEAILNVSELVLARTFKPWLYYDFILNQTSFGKQHNQTLKILHDFTRGVIKERKDKLKERKLQHQENENDDELFGKRRLAFLDLLLDASKDGTLLSDTDIREEVDTFMFEGHDTTTIAISWCLFLLGNNPDIQDKVFEELDSIFGKDDRQITMSDIAEMKYLERVIKESLRLYPSVPFISRRSTKTFYVDNYEIPPDTALVLHIYDVLRNPEHFPEPERFDPDRFLPEACLNRHPFAYIPFSAGPRNCIGQKFALMEEKTMVASIVRKYKITSLHKPKDMKIYPELVLRPQQAIKVKLEKR